MAVSIERISGVKNQAGGRRNPGEVDDNIGALGCDFERRHEGDRRDFRSATRLQCRTLGSKTS